MLRCAVIGDPVAHSASPQMFSWLAVRLGLEVSYQAIRLPAPELPAFLDDIRAGRWDGISVTIPHKEAALTLADGRTSLAVEAGAANCLQRTAAGQVVAHNTDVLGVERALEHHRVSLRGAHVLILGAGGAARAAAVAASRNRAASLTLAARNPARAAVLAERFGGRALPLTLEALELVLPGTTVLLQATPVGLVPPDSDGSERLASALPDGCVLHRSLTVMDMVYRPLRTRLLRDAQAASARPIDGLWMLVFQGLAQLELWTGMVPPDGTAEALRAHLAEGA
jgi:shikimate dehydrogenase